MATLELNAKFRQSECRGLRWSDWDEQNQTLNIERTVWKTQVGATRDPASENVIPILPLVGELLADRKRRLNPKPTDFIFAGQKKGSPLDFHNLINRVIKPALARAAKERIEPDEHLSVEWKGFHGFRRGLASNLYSLGVHPKVIASLLRHADLGTTLQFYVQTPESEARAALMKLQEIILSRSVQLAKA